MLGGLTTAYTYYPWTMVAGQSGHQQGGRVKRLLTTNAIPQVFQDLNYTYDPNGNITDIDDQHSFNTNSPVEDLAYTYDTVNRLKTVKINSVTTETMAYDNLGRLIQKTSGVSIGYGSSAHLHAATSMGTNTYTYDTNGGLKTMSSYGASFTYDAENQVTKMQWSLSGISRSSTYTYDGDGKRVKAVNDPNTAVAGDEVTTVYLGSLYEKQGTIVRKYYYAGAQRIYMRESGAFYHLLTDHLGSTSITLNVAGTWTGELRYTARGETRTTQGTTLTPLRYTGQSEDSGLPGLYFRNSGCWVLTHHPLSKIHPLQK